MVNKAPFKKVEEVVQRMLDPDKGLPFKNVHGFVNKLHGVVAGENT